MPRRLFLLALAGLLPLPAMADEVVVFAAASLKTALDAVAADFTAQTGDTVTISYAGSSQLANQIIQGAPADIFISASVNWMDTVEDAGLVDPGSRVNLLGNTLVLIAHGDIAALDIVPGLDLAGLLGDGRLAMALVDSVPAGQYGKAALETLGLWDGVEPMVAQADNVRAALALVALGEAPYGIVYATDAIAEPAVTVAGIFPADSHPEILYPSALLTGAEGPADRAFHDYLASDAADAIFAANGFAVLN